MPTTTTKIEAWNVVSSGPSMAFIEPSDLIPGCPVVSINRSIRIIDRGINVDFACFADPPSAIVGVFDLEKYLVPPIQVWCPRSALYMDRGLQIWHDMVTLWEPFLPASVGIRTTPFGTVTSVDGKTKRFLFCLLAALERVMMFRPKKVRILCADMMGSWAPGMTEEECEMHQSLLEQARRDVSRAQKRVNDTKGENPGFVSQLELAQRDFNYLLNRGDPGIFKRWEHERFQVRELEKRANANGCEFEFHSPKGVVLT